MADGSVTIDTKLNDDGIEKGTSKLKNTFSKIGSIAGTALKGVTIAIGSATTALVGLGTASVDSYADLEQNIGGIETLFKGSAEKVIKNAENAYKTAGMSANEYMSTVTSFSASLLQSLGGDTEKAAESADMAITDMADNANKMGTSMEAIQVAYQGFAKQNYTMLDNLKLGYGGTKTEMERLLADAEKISGVKYDISNLNDVYSAIHVIQGELGITGTTAKEASETITGSVSSMKAAWDNFLNGSGTIEQFVDSAIIALQNIIGAVGDLLPSIVESIAAMMPEIIETINQIFPQILQLLTENLPTILSSIGQILSAILQAIIDYIPQLIPIAIQLVESFINGLLSMLPQLLEAGIVLLAELIKGIAEMLPELIPKAIECIMNLVETLIDNLPLLIDAGIELIIALAEGLIEALPRLLEKVPIIIEKLLNYISNNIPKIIQMGITLLIKLAAGLIQAIPQLIACIPQIIGALVSGLANAAGQLINAGANLVKGIWQGISNTINWIWSKISGFCNSIVSKIKSFFGIHSPSKLFADEIGQNLGLGLGEGFDDSLSSVYKDMQKAVEHENTKLTSNLTSTHQIQIQNEDNRQARLESIDNNKEIVVNTTTNLDSKVIARETNKVNARQKLQYGIA